MATPLDQAYLWSINPVTGKDPSGRSGLGSLIPGAGLAMATRPKPIDFNLPKPQFSDDAASYFNWEPQAAQDVATSELLSGEIPFQKYASPGVPSMAVAPGKTPYFDPNFPYESLDALRNYLKPQVQQSALAGLRARGLTSTGVGDMAQTKATDYLDTIMPDGMDAEKAVAADFSRLYGPAMANSLLKGSEAGASGYPIIPTLSGGAGAQFGEGETAGLKAALLRNPNYSFMGGVNPPGTDTPTFPGPRPDDPPGTIRPLGAGTPPTPAPMPSQQPSTPLAALTPQWGLVDFGAPGGNYYPGPGYFYNPNQMPDASRMPWLKDATY